MPRWDCLALLCSAKAEFPEVLAVNRQWTPHKASIGTVRVHKSVRRCQDAIVLPHSQAIAAAPGNVLLIYNSLCLFINLKDPLYLLAFG